MDQAEKPACFIDANLGGQSLRFLTVRGLPGSGKITRSVDLLARAMQIRPTDRVLDLGCGYGPLGVAAAKLEPNAQVFLLDWEIRSVRACRNNVRINRAPNAKVVFDDTLQAFAADRFDVILCSPHPFVGKSLVFEMIEEAAGHLRDGGSLYLAGSRDRGILSYAQKAAQVLGNAEPVLKCGGCRVLRSVRRGPNQALMIPTRAANVFEEPLRGRKHQFLSPPGVFSEGQVDQGTRLLIQHMDVSAEDRVLDLGCGYGAIGIVAADLASKGAAWLVDSNLRAIKAARQNLALNQIERARALVSDGFEGVDDQTFDLIVTNPPLHGGTYTGRRFIQGAKGHLAAGGRMVLVAMRYAGYQRLMRATFGNLKIIKQLGGYAVLCSTA